LQEELLFAIIVAWMYSYQQESTLAMKVSVTNGSPSTITEDVCQQRCIHPEHALAVRRNLLTAETAHAVSDLFSVLSDPTRVQVVYALLHAPTGELCVCDLAAGLGRDDTTISHQLRVLRAHHIVSMRKAGRIVYYRLVDEHIRRLLAIGLTHANEPLSAALQLQETEASA
jgi:ArsR family transcriptional regulator, lead/cadmium/zinc/bismuth-responsive transcriptional repressor